jgi:hypothetical protein
MLLAQQSPAGPAIGIGELQAVMLSEEKVIRLWLSPKTTQGYLSDCILGGDVFLALLLLYLIGRNLVVRGVRICDLHLERRINQRSLDKLGPGQDKLTALLCRSRCAGKRSCSLIFLFLACSTERSCLACLLSS